MGVVELVYDPPCCFRGFGSFILSPPWAWIQHVPPMTDRGLPGESLESMLMWIATLEHTLRTRRSPKLDEFGLQILANIEYSVQHPLIATFGWRDLVWALEFKAHRGKHQRNSVVQQYCFSISHLLDFIVGMQCGKEGARCLYRDTKENHKRPNHA